MSIPLVVGCPVHRRQRCMEEWFDSVEAQELPPGTRFVFALSEPGDPTERIILRRAPDAELFWCEGLPAFGEDEKDDPRRYAVLAHIRNRLLRYVGSMDPEAFLSWDSDIILEPGAVRAMMGVRADAVGALVDMGGDVYPGTWSWMHLDGEDAYRPPSPVPYAAHDEAPARPVGVVMGAVLMRRRGYRRGRYAPHPLGEDVGWAINCERLGVGRWICPAARGRHLYRLS